MKFMLWYGKQKAAEQSRRTITRWCRTELDNQRDLAPRRLNRDLKEHLKIIDSAYKKQMHTDWIIIGAGLTGATLAQQIASQLGESVLLVEQRDHIAGNAYDEFNEHGILVHKYGPHIFHTNDETVWNYLSQFTEWRNYTHHVQASVDGKLIPLPFNLNSIELLFSKQLSKRLTAKLIDTYGIGAKIPILKMLSLEDDDLRSLATYVYKKVFERYTHKQWGLKPEELPPSITARVPISITRDDRYFQDAYQAMPLSGYTVMVQNMIRHPKIQLMLSTKWDDIKNRIKYKRLIYTGSIDQYFNYKNGKLPYRSLNFKHETIPIDEFQTSGVINYPNEHDYTRITEFKHLTGQSSPLTTILYEYPKQHIIDKNIPHYPIPIETNRAKYRLYKEEAAKMIDSVMFAGRLGDYRYYNMDQAIARALKVASKI